MSNQKKRYQEAKKQVRKEKEFYTHLIIYMATIMLLFVINQTTSPSVQWWIYAAGGWGIGVLSDFINVFGVPGFGKISSKKWEEEQIQKKLEEYEEEDPQYADVELPEIEEEWMDLEDPDFSQLEKNEKKSKWNNF